MATTDKIEELWPEHAKLSAPLPEPITTVAELSQRIGEFLDWLTHEHPDRPVLCVYLEDDDGMGGYAPSGHTIPSLLAAHFKIDDHKLDREKKEMLAYLRQAGAEVIGQKMAARERTPDTAS